MKFTISNSCLLCIIVFVTNLMSSYGDSATRVSLQLDSWKQLSKSDIEQFGIVDMPSSGSFWRNPDTGAMLIFSEHTANKTTQDIKAAIAGIGDSAMKKGISPDSVEQISIWSLPAFKMTGTMKPADVKIHTTFIYALGGSASYQAILFEYEGKPCLTTNGLVKINDSVNPKAKEAIGEIIKLLEPSLPMMRAYVENQSKSK